MAQGYTQVEGIDFEHYERLDPQFTNYQFKLIVKQLMCEI